MIHWKLFLTTLPFVAALLGMTFVRDSVLHIPPLLEFSDLAPILTGAALISGLMLSGVLADYKESEKLPSSAAGGLAWIEDNAIGAVAAGQPLDLAAVRTQILVVCDTIDAFLTGRASLAEFFTAIGRLNTLTALPAGGDSHFTVAMLDGARNTRGAISRIATIRDTSFIQTGYVLLDLLVGSSMVLLLVAHFKSTMSQYLIIAFVSLTYIYLLRLIRDLDNPFDYAADGTPRGSTEVDLATLRGFRRYIQSSLPAAVPATAVRPPAP